MSSGRAISTEGRLTAEILRELPVAELVAYVNGGDEEATSDAFLEIARRFEPLLRKAWNRNGRGEYADFAHEVFARTFAALPRLKTPAAFPAFFRSVVVSVAADQWRKPRLKEVDVDRETLEQTASAIDEVLVTALVVRSYLEHLGDRERNVLEWEVVDGLSTDEIAMRLGITAGAVRTTKSRALEKIREVIAREARMIERLRKT
jgi:RNA polymerase sigma-70 factor (ECF subfamily)